MFDVVNQVVLSLPFMVKLGMLVAAILWFYHSFKKMHILLEAVTVYLVCGLVLLLFGELFTIKAATMFGSSVTSVALSVIVVICSIQIVVFMWRYRETE